jgi:hypothetical protein
VVFFIAAYKKKTGVKLGADDVPAEVREQMQAVPDDIRNPESLVLYVDTAEYGLPAELLIHNRWHRDPHGSIVIRQLFWRNLLDDPAGVAPVTLIYADLLASREPRQLEVARHMRRRDDRLARL